MLNRLGKKTQWSWINSKILNKDEMGYWNYFWNEITSDPSKYIKQIIYYFCFIMLIASFVTRNDKPYLLFETKELHIVNWSIKMEQMIIFPWCSIGGLSHSQMHRFILRLKNRWSLPDFTFETGLGF